MARITNAFVVNTTLLVLLAVTVGCARATHTPPMARATRAPKPRAAATTMPPLVGRTLGQAKAALRFRDPAVVFPGVEATFAIAARQIQGVEHPAKSGTFTIPLREIQLSLLKDIDAHKVISQTPQPGSVLTTATTITLVAGAHPGNAGHLWFDAHPETVKSEGANQCFDCHDERYCSKCHMPVLGSNR